MFPSEVLHPSRDRHRGLGRILTGSHRPCWACTLIFLALGSIQKSTSWWECTISWQDGDDANHIQYNRGVDRVCVDRIPFGVTVEVRITRVPIERSLLEIISRVPRSWWEAASSGMLRRVILLMYNEWHDMVWPGALTFICSSFCSFFSILQACATDVLTTPAKMCWSSSRWLEWPVDSHAVAHISHQRPSNGQAWRSSSIICGRSASLSPHITLMPAAQVSGVMDSNANRAKLTLAFLKLCKRSAFESKASQVSVTRLGGEK